jgi:hypothetical protein
MQKIIKQANCSSILSLSANIMETQTGVKGKEKKEKRNIAATMTPQ